MFKRILVANRGEIALRIIRTCRDMGIESVLVYSDVDKDSLAVALADKAICIGSASPNESYLDKKKIITAAILTNSEAIHPGYGFLAENSEFAAMVQKNNLIFIGADAKVIKSMGDKILARSIMEKAHVPVIPGSDEIRDIDSLKLYAREIGYPVLLKASQGGGGKGMRIVNEESDLERSFLDAKKEAKNAFGDDTIYIEKYIINAKHIEVQILADKFGNVIHLGERDCSIQKNNQKLIEEAPASTLSLKMQKNMRQVALEATKSVGYVGAGTFEFLVTEDAFYFIEMNVRIQVEHPVTEMITGVDIVKEQIRIAYGLNLSINNDNLNFSGHAIECRINAQNVKQNFFPSVGKINDCYFPQGPNVRVDSGISRDSEILPYYDSMIAKIIVHGATRLEAIKRMRRALVELVIDGIETTSDLDYLILHHPVFVLGKYNTKFLDCYLDEMIEVL